MVQMAAVLVIGPIFEVDLLPQQHGFRPGLDAEWLSDGSTGT
jgi:RNA-directed DNA polymerase